MVSQELKVCVHVHSHAVHAPPLQAEAIHIYLYTQPGLINTAIAMVYHVHNHSDSVHVYVYDSLLCSVRCLCTRLYLYIVAQFST